MKRKHYSSRIVFAIFIINSICCSDAFEDISASRSSIYKSLNFDVPVNRYTKSVLRTLANMASVYKVGVDLPFSSLER